MCINERLKEIRKALNLNQSDMAEKLGMKQGSYSGIESGKKGTITKKTEKMLEYLFDVNIEYLLNGKGEMFNNDVRKENPINISGSSGTNITGGSIYNNTSNNSNNHISIILPENGYKKIINSTGKETTLKMSDDEMPVVESLSAENRFLKQRITDLEKIIETKDDIINMYKGLIKHS